ncbi:hypothetical protein G6F35_018760 [Rhizopus arrhizus]|uniref:Uncharacterized protein n=1 Tax=Rhizopus delemar TaxID=936053 RepID=A0A9P6XQX6_9FUNG|nr:hypothetical protein G6F35_018760 [Rhizopus arrhizus]KAG1530751.1 hypothetical protein G6F50_017109 [Rhizopus delemar]
MIREPIHDPFLYRPDARRRARQPGSLACPGVSDVVVRPGCAGGAVWRDDRRARRQRAAEFRRPRGGVLHRAGRLCRGAGMRGRRRHA